LSAPELRVPPTESPTSPPLPLANCYWVVPGRLLAGEYPAGATPEATRERLMRLREAGVAAFIDLTEPGELSSYEPELPPGILYLRRPIPDHGLPEERSQMAGILESLRHALASPHSVYLHCRAGIGRTGMVAGCFLADSGLGGEGALEELNRLWQQSARSAQWPSVPETGEQVEYVRRWTPSPGAAETDPLLEPSTLAAARGLRERFLGALLGLALGDAIAAATQFKRPGRFAPVGDLIGGGPFDLPRGAWSDDTAMALCLAESLLERGGFDARDQVGRYLRWQQEGYLSATGQCVGITAGTARALALAQWRRQVFSGSHDPEVLDPETLPRVTPVVMYFFADAGQGEEHAAQAARTTCQAPAVLTACRSLARGLHAALAGRSRAEIVASATPAPRAARTASAAGAATAPGALGAALEALARTGNFRDALLTAANLGGNSDVVASVTGALAGAHYTASAIPALWRNSLMKQGLIESFADRLLAHALLELGD
jgi:ADP-ribosyl-[dinitrogen reductase] hydrolase